jgi:hypothetical protein
MVIILYLGIQIVFKLQFEPLQEDFCNLSTECYRGDQLKEEEMS